MGQAQDMAERDGRTDGRMANTWDGRHGKALRKGSYSHQQSTRYFRFRLLFERNNEDSPLTLALTHSINHLFISSSFHQRERGERGE